MGTFLVLMSVTFVLVYINAENRAKRSVRTGLEDINNIVLDKMKYIQRRNLSDDVQYLQKLFKDGTDFKNNKKLADEIRQRLDWYAEENVVGPDGIIVLSTTEDNEGFDMKSVKKSAEFLSRIRESPEVCRQDMKLKSEDDPFIIYYGMYMPEYGGFIMLGINQAGYQNWHSVSMKVQVENNRIGKTGYCLYLNPEAEILGCFRELDFEESPISPEELKQLAETREVIKKEISGVSSYIGAYPTDTGYIVAVYPFSEVWTTWNILILILLIIYVVIFSILFGLINSLITKQVTQGVYSLNEALGAISRGDLEKKADFRGSLEFDGLSDGINLTVGRLKDLIKEAEGRIDAELALAANIQVSFLPREFPPFPERNEFRLFASMTPAKEVGGDFYDFFFTDEDHLALVIADVSGKGIPAAMFMAAAINEIRSSVMKYGTKVAEAAREVNTQLCRENDAMFFVTVWLGVFTVSTGHMDYVDAGHNYPAIYRSGEKFTLEDDVHSLPFAAWEESVFEAGSFELFPGDILYLYTDGVTEANDPGGELFGERRMLEALNKDVSLSVEATDAAVREEIAKFASDAPQSDDITMLVFKYTGSRG